MALEKCDLSVSSIQDILTYQANLLDGFKTGVNGNRSMYTVYGRLCANRSEWFASGSWYYNVPLKDLNNPQKIIYLNFPIALADETCNLRGYEYISIHGYLKIVVNQYKLETRFYPSNIQIINQNDYALVETNKVFSSFFKSIEIRHYDFPFYQELSIAVIVPQTGSSFDEFKNQIGISDNIYLDKILVNILSLESITSAVNKVIQDKQHNVLVIIRGGGDKTALDVFDDLDICELVAKFEGYKLIGIGHTRDRSLLELVVNYAADTPTAAGSHIKNIITNLESFKNKFTDEVQSEMYSKLLDAEREFEQSLSTVRLDMSQKLLNSEQKISALSKKLSNSRYINLLLATFIAISGYYIFSSHELLHTTDIEKNTSDITQELKPAVTDNASNNQKHK